MIALSSGESEFYAVGKGVAHGLYVVQLVKELGQNLRLVVLTDSAAARGMMGRIGAGKVRHMQTRYLWW